MRAANLFEKGAYDAEVARRCKVSQAAVHKWRKIWKKKGKEGLKSTGPPGVKSKLTEDKKEEVRKALLLGPKHAGYSTEIWTLERIANLIKNKVKIKYHPGNVWKVMKSMGWSCQKPETRARERNENKIKYWKRVKWPEIQKRGKRQEQLSGF